MPIRAHVLSIQDNADDTQLLQAVWGNDEEIKLTCRKTGALGIEHLQTEDQRIPNLILLAGRFPLSQIATLDVLRMLKTDPQLRYIPVVVFSAADPRTILSFYDAHAACVIAMPHELHAFAAMLAVAKAFGSGLREDQQGQTLNLMRAAWRVTASEEGEKRLQQLARFLEQDYPTAAAWAH